MFARILLLIGLSVIFAYPAPITTLTIKETAGIARVEEDVTMGVPLPTDLWVTDVTKITLRDGSNNIIPCAVKKLSGWFKTPQAARWVQLNFPYSVAASATGTVTLSLDASSYTLPSKLTAVDNGTTITVNTGKIRFIVKKANFNLLDQVWVDQTGAESYSAANQIVASHARGIVHYLSNVEYLSSNDAASTVVIERQDAGVITLKATGLLKNASSVGTLNFESRIYAYNNSASVKMQNTVEYHSPVTTNTVNIQGLHLEIPMNLGASKTAVVGTPGGSVQAAVSGAQDAWCMVQRPAGTNQTAGSVINGSVGGAVAASTFNPKSTKPKDIGWVGISDGTKGCVAGLKYFWQMVPTSVEAFGDGKIVLAAFSKRSGNNPLIFFAGTGRSSESQWTFFNTATPADMRSKAVGITDRLYALASPFWYTRRTNSAVHMVEVNQNIYTPANWNTVSAWDTKMNSIWSSVMAADDSWLGYDSYGWMEWGDNPHYATGLPQPCEMFWNGNYYGMDFFALEQFYHTGDTKYLYWGIAHAKQVADVHQLHFGSTDANTGSSRYCPPANHIATDDGACTPDFGNMSHHKIEAMFLNYYLTGDDYSLECALQAATWSANQNFTYAQGADNVGVYIRRWAHQMNDLVWGYEYNQTPLYFSRLWQNWEVFRKNIWTPAVPTGNEIGQPFMVGLGMEAVTKMYYILTPTYTTNLNVVKPDSVGYYLKIWCDRVFPLAEGTGSMQYNANVTIGYAFLGQPVPFYGATYLTQAAQKAALLPNTPNNLHKDFAQQARNLEQAMYYFAIPDSVNKYSSVEKKRGDLDVGEPEMEIGINPSPFNPSTSISLSGKALVSGVKPMLRVYSMDGSLVKDLSKEIDNSAHSVIWNAQGASSNVYLIKCIIGNRTFTKKTTLLK